MSALPGLHALRPERLLVVAARPGAADQALAGSVARWVGEGSAAHLVCCTSGDASDGDASIDPLAVAARQEREQRAAAARLGYEAVTFLHRPEGALANDLALREQLVRVVRAFRPDAVALPDPRDLIHSDGSLVPADMRAAGEAAIDSIEPSRRAMAFPHLVTAEGLAPHAVAQLYLYASERPTGVVDIGVTLAAKLDALGKLSADAPATRALETRVRAAAASAGAHLGLAAAESFAFVDLPS